MAKFKVGDTAWYGKCRWEPVKKICPTCFGNRQVTLILGNGDYVTLPCNGCAPGYEEPTGQISEYEHVVEPERIHITKVIVEMTDEGETAEYRGGHYVFHEKDLFSTKEEARRRGEEKKQKMDEDQTTRAECIKKNIHKKFSWNAHYHMREAKDHRKQAEYHDAKAVLCKARAKGGDDVKSESL